MMQAKNSIINFLKAYFFVAVLWVLVLFSAVSVVYSVFDSRVKFDALESLRLEQMALQVSWGQYLLEESTWASYDRVERIAIEELAMRIPEPKQVVLVSGSEN